MHLGFGAGKFPAMSNREPVDRGAMRLLPYMGVIWVVAEAEKLGFYNGHPDWCNLGQGQPEIGALAGAPERWSKFDLEPIDHAYGPVHGTVECREAVADYYNRTFRSAKSSKYTAANVAIAAGGRLALSRAMTALGTCNLGFQVPDYSAYEDMIGVHLERISPIPVPTYEADGFGLLPERLETEIVERGLGAFLISNPCNPTGRVIRGAALAEWVAIARRRRCTLLLDEFYSHYIYDGDQPAAGPVSAAASVDDVDRDPVLLFDGLTKNWRYPGWRLGWVVGPKDMIETLITAGSSVDGGPSRVIQRQAVSVLAKGRAEQETTAVRRAFVEKRNLMIARLKALGVRFAHEGESTFYLWGSVEGLKPPFNDAMTFFRAALEKKVMTVPGPFFDVNPGKRRPDTQRFSQWLRFSFGPPLSVVRTGLDRLATL